MTNPLTKTHGICPPEDPRWHWMPPGMASSVTASREGSLGSGEVPRCKIATAKRKNRHCKEKKNPQEGGSGKQTMIALMRLKIYITKSKDQLIFHLIAAALRKTEFEMAITSTFNVAREGKEMRRELFVGLPHQYLHSEVRGLHSPLHSSTNQQCFIDHSFSEPPAHRLRLCCDASPAANLPAGALLT